MDSKSIGAKIRQYRKLKGQTQEFLAQRANLSVMSIRRYESGERIATESALKRIASALDIEMTDIIDDLGENVSHLEAVMHYLERMGFSVKENVVNFHEEEIDEPPGKIQVEDEFEIILSKDGHSAIFTEKEFDDLIIGAKEAIEGRFYKKVLEQQGRK